MRSGRQADAVSRDTRFSGLPKAVKLAHSAGQGPTVGGVSVAMAYDTVAWNYGGYALVPGTTIGTGTIRVILPEPGIYDLKGQVYGAAGTPEILAGFDLNSTGAAVPVLGVTSIPPSASWGNRGIIAGEGEFKAGDSVALIVLTSAAKSFDNNYSNWFSITKRGGVY